jgi:SAM-dependent MidA family methyltransferase
VVADLLATPGDTDITAGIDFGLIADHARACGLAAFPTVSQHDALMALGFAEWFHGQLATQHAQLDARDGIGAVRTWADKSRATLLGDPGGLGRFRWMVLATPGLPAPQWLTSGPSTDRP